MSTEIEQLKQQLEAANRACSKMRGVLEEIKRDTFPLNERYAYIQNALSTDCGKDMFTREQVMPIIKELARMEGLVGLHCSMLGRKQFGDALTHARSIGLLKEGE